MTQNPQSQAPNCHNCGVRPEQISAEALITRRHSDAGRSGSRIDVSERTYCAACIEALGLDWCCQCYRWRLAGQIDSETEVCRDCGIAPRKEKHHA